MEEATGEARLGYFGSLGSQIKGGCGDSFRGLVPLVASLLGSLRI